MSPRRPGIPTRLLLLLSAAVLLLPVYGSWIDFRFAERQPSHKHIYFGKVNLHHHRTSDNEGVVNLPDQDATVQTVASVGLPDEIVVANAAGSDSLAFTLADDYLFPEDAFLPPPDRPPRL